MLHRTFETRRLGMLHAYDRWDMLQNFHRKPEREDTFGAPRYKWKTVLKLTIMKQGARMWVGFKGRMQKIWVSKKGKVMLKSWET
jgi:hypothetical protein